MIEQLEKERKKIKAKLRYDADPEMDFIFWSRYEKEVASKTWGAKLWAPLLLLGLLGLVALSAFLQPS